MAREYKKLEVWKRSIKFCKVISELADTFPNKEDWALGSQIRRAVISVPSNIAEGCGRRTNKDSCQFFYVALGSINEVVTQLYIAREFEYIEDGELENLDRELDEIGRMLMGLIGYVSGM